MDYHFLTELCSRTGTEFEENAELSRYSTMKIGGCCDLLIKPSDESVLLEALEICRSEGIRYFILGNGSNVIFKDFKGVVISTRRLCGVAVEGETITAASGATLAEVCSKALEGSLSGMEPLFGIPGSVGGALYMNAGAFGGEMRDIVVSARCVNKNGETVTVPAADMKLGYRHSVFSENGFCILSVTMKLKKGSKAAIKALMDELMKRRRDRQPLEYPSCGSTFKRPENGFAAALIEECGLKGHTVGGAQVSEKHSGFVINKNGASFEDVISLVEYIKKVVSEKKGVALECEMVVVDD